MKLTTLKPRLQEVGNRLPTLKVSAGTVERKRGSAGVKDRERIRARDYGLCQACRREDKISIGVDVDHIVALADSGSDHDDNKELLCEEHHRAKSTAEAARRAAG